MLHQSGYAGSPGLGIGAAAAQSQPGRTLEVAALSLRDARNSHGSAVTAAITHSGNQGPPGDPRPRRGDLPVFD